MAHGESQKGMRIEDQITDIWFRTPLPLADLARGLALTDVVEDCENVWEWLIGSFEGERINISRTHLEPAAEVDTGIMLVREAGPKRSLDQAFASQLASRLRAVGVSPVFLGILTVNKDDQTEVITVVRKLP